MRLSQIKLAGFKSFVDPSALPLPSNLTSIVGPNGCGKSNVIDAVRWVLGESSMKQLRSESMDDVIFNGSRTRKPVGRASVELMFDNADATVQGPYAAYNEIAVKRELTRDGGSQYYLNGSKCLKRDVLDLFLGTGLGNRTGYAIIEQGMVSRMIEAKPEELRVWLEEAAGISKYKERRRETESRIRGTRENLSRLNDLRGELQARLDTLRRQAANAEKFKEFKEQERLLKAELLALRVREQERACATQEAAISQCENALEAARAAAQSQVQARGLAETTHREANAGLTAEQSRVYEVEAELARLEQNLQHAHELKTLKQREIDQLALQLRDLEQRNAQEAARLESLRRAEQAQAEQAEQAVAREAAAQSALIEAEEVQATVQTRWEEFTQRAEAPLVQTEGERVRARELERGLSQADERLQRVQKEHAALDLSPLQSSLFDVDEELARLQVEIENGQARLQILDESLTQLREERSALDSALHESRQTLQSSRGRMASLETLQNAALRQDDQALGEWLKSLELQEAPRLASIIQVEAGWESAVEYVLGDLLQAPIAPQTSTLEQTRLGPKTGAALVAASESDGAVAPGRLAARVRGPAGALAWLQTIHCADSAEAAAQLLPSLPAGESVIDTDGVWRGHGWVRFPRAEQDKGGVIARGRLLKQLRQQAEEVAALVREREQQLDAARQRMQAMEAERRELAGRFDQSRQRQAQRMAYRQAQAVRLEQIQTRARQLQTEIEAQTQAREERAHELAEARSNLSQLEAVAERLRGERVELQQAQAQARDALNQARGEMARVQQGRNQTQVQLASTRSSLTALEQALEELTGRRESLAEQHHEQQQRAAELDQPIAAHRDELEAARVATQAARDALRAARERCAAAETGLTQVLQQQRAADTAVETARERLQQTQLDSQAALERRRALTEQFTETGFEYAALVADLSEESTPAVWEEKLASMARRIERLGAINLAAIQELEEAGGRESVLAAQYDDITAALETLEEAIRKIDKETKDRFRLTFDRVNAIFRDRFPKLFGGGEANLELTGEDLLDTGVRVMARPPGKRNTTIHLLSGGEKAMTAVALLFALFELNPAPFCMLDEVDAPLDDANVGRFVDVIREMSTNVQFIIITHNKITMELAEHLHGVTMQEPGVSRLVSVDVNQALELAGEAA